MAPAKRLMLKSGKRVFRCGCIQEKPEQVVFRSPNYKAFCAEHLEPMIGVQVKCVVCGKVEVVPVGQGRQKTCVKCKRVRETAKRRKRLNQKPLGGLTDEQKQYIADHLHTPPAEIAETIGVDRKAVARYMSDIGVSWGSNHGTPGRRAVEIFLDRAAARLLYGGSNHGKMAGN